MPVPSRMSVQRFPHELRARVQIADAVAWEALIETHVMQAMVFLREFSPRVSALPALDLYFRVVPVLEPMVESIRGRTLASTDLDALLPRIPVPGPAGWKRLRPDLQIRHLREQRNVNERTLELARLAGAQSAEALLGTHVRNALDFAVLVARVLSFEKAVDRYVREFSLSMATSQAVSQRAQAEIATQQLARQYRETSDLDEALDFPLPDSLDDRREAS